MTRFMRPDGLPIQYYVVLACAKGAEKIVILHMNRTYMLLKCSGKDSAHPSTLA